jgi:hypothetical protein
LTEILSKYYEFIEFKAITGAIRLRSMVLPVNDFSGWYNDNLNGLTIQNRRSGRSDDNRMNVSFNRLMWGQ